MTMAFIDTDLPVPVAPATRRCGMRARSATTTFPVVSLPSARASFESACSYSTLSSSSPMKTFSRRGLETSMPTTGFPGMGASTRTESARSAIERSSARVTMRFTLTPGAGSKSKVVITGPGRTATTLPATWKSASLVSRMRELACSAASSSGCVVRTGGSRRLSAGRR